MKSLFKLLIVSFLISLVGSLPLGILNISAIHISTFIGKYQAISFSIGAVFVELIYVRITLFGIHIVEKKKQTLKYVSNVILIAFALYNLFLFFVPSNTSYLKTINNNNSFSFFVLGVFTNAINFLQITFWSACNIVLYKKNLLKNDLVNYSVYLFSIGIGTFICFLFFIYGGNYMKNYIVENKSIYHLSVVVIIFLVLVFQNIKNFKLANV